MENGGDVASTPYTYAYMVTLSVYRMVYIVSADATDILPKSFIIYFIFPI